MAKSKSARGGAAVDIFGRVEALARNLWWTWNSAAQRLFAALDPVLWEATNRNPLEVLAQLPPERRAALVGDDRFLSQLAQCEAELQQYLRARTWFQRTASTAQKRTRIAYFCAEYALHESFPQYSGGLGVLAGDHLKSASDLGVPLCAVGLLYRCGYYQQSFDADGATRVAYPECDFARLAVNDTGKRVAVPVGRRHVWAKIWRVQVGRVPLFMLDTDVPENKPADRAITRHLYGGDNETRIQQEIVLGVGGLMALDELGIQPTVFHLNEGHAAFCGLARLRQHLIGGATLDGAVQRVRNSTVFTTHTPVPAGHDRFAPGLVTRYLMPLMDGTGVDRATLLKLGRERAGAQEPFCMTVLALLLSGKRNGVSKLHGEVSRAMWQHLAPLAKNTKAVPIGYVTNGVHAQTWLAPEIEPLYRKYLRPKWDGAGPEDNWWRNADRIPPAELWAVRRTLRAKLVHFIRARLRQQIERRLGPVEELAAAYETFDEDALTIGFARRFATYKRAPLIFMNARRVAEILNQPGRPVQLVFAGKAHPKDAPGQEFAQLIYQNARKAGLRGRVVLLENYDMNVGRILTSGCDVWLNNPLRPQEASGTSGMKPPLHGGLNCSILDGWWPEAYNGRNGWAIGDGSQRADRAAQDRADAARIYELLEKEIVPAFYERGRDGLPRKWIGRMVSSMKTVCGQFNTHRMVAEYVREYYLGG